ncbi:MAG: hypothetical protein R3C32_02230 [Chloroflexota bacterium]
MTRTWPWCSALRSVSPRPGWRVVACWWRSSPPRRLFGQPSGAQAMLDAGLFDDGEPSAVLGLHCWPDLPAGEVGLDERIAMGAKDAFSIELRAAAHAATPSRGRDAILGLGALVTDLHMCVGRALDATDRAAFNIGTVSGEVAERRRRRRHAHRHAADRDPDVRSRLRSVVER